MSGIGPLAEIAAATAQHRDGGAVLDPAAMLRRLVPNSQHAGLVVGTTADGRPQVSIDAALLTLEGDVSLPTGTRVVVRVTAVAPALAIELRVLGDARAPRQGASTPPPPAAVPATNPAASAAAAATVPSAGRAPPATVTLLTPMSWRDGPPPTGIDSIPPAAAAEHRLPPGTQLPVRIAVAALPSGAPDASGTLNASGAPDIAVAAAPTLAPGVRVAAVVAAVLADGRAVITVAGGGDMLVSSKTASLVVGENLLLTVEDAPLRAAASVGLAATPPPPATPWTTLAAAWPSFEAEVPAATRTVLRAALPRPDAGLGESVRTLLAAARAGDARVWLGDRAVEWLARHQPELLAGIVRDLDETAASADGGTGDDGWSTITLPLMMGTAIEPIRLRMRRRSAPQRQGSGNDDQRFVLDVTLGRLGRVQLDTMVRAVVGAGAGTTGKAPRLDIVVRSECPLDVAARQGIRALAQATGERNGIGVTVGFQAAPAGFVDAAPPPSGGPVGGVIV